MTKGSLFRAPESEKWVVLEADFGHALYGSDPCSGLTGACARNPTRCFRPSKHQLTEKADAQKEAIASQAMDVYELFDL